MECYVHPGTEAAGVCGVCQRAICRSCVAVETPRLVCSACSTRGIIGFEYKTEAAIGPWPILHICFGTDPVRMRPKVAKGVIAIGNLAVGGIAIGSVALGVIGIGGLGVGLLGALGGAAIGFGLSIGGFAFGSVAIGGMAVGLSYALGGAAFGPAVISGERCDEAAREFFSRYVGDIMPACGQTLERSR